MADSNKTQNMVYGVCICVCLVAGAILGFSIGGVGGAIVFGIAGAILGLFLPDIIVGTALVGGVLLLAALGIFILVFVVRLIVSLWGVGR